MNWLRKIFAAFSFGLPDFHYGKDETTYDMRKVQPIESKRVQYAPGGSVEAVRKYYGTTIAGGPGSQKIGDTFKALPESVRNEMIAARKGKIRQLRPGEESGEQHELPGVQRRHGIAAIANALNTRYTRGVDGRLKLREDHEERVDHDTRRRLAGKEPT